MKTIDHVPVSVSDIFDERAETRFLASVYYPYLVAGLRQGIDQGRGGRSRKAEDEFTETVQRAIRQRAFAHALIATNTTKDKLQVLLLEATREGYGVQDLAREIQSFFTVEARTRSLLIAHTELTGVINDGVDRTLRAEGPQKVEWGTVIDGQERTAHHNAHGQVVGIDEKFTLTDETGTYYARYPGDDTLPVSQIANCRCTKLGAGYSAETKRAFNKRFLHVHGSLERPFMVHLRRAFAAQRQRVLNHFPS